MGWNGSAPPETIELAFPSLKLHRIVLSCFMCAASLTIVVAVLFPSRPHGTCLLLSLKAPKPV